MSIISQFFPSSGGGGGNETPTGIKIPADCIPVEILGFSGSGGGGGSASYQGEGGSGAVMHATNYSVQPGCTVPITIGAGGAQGGCPCGQGSQGGITSFNYPVLPISVIGGGGGAGLDPNNLICNGCPGGTGGGTTRHYSTIACGTSAAGDGFYFNKINEYSSSFFFQCSGNCAGRSWQSVTKVSDAEMETTPWGCRGGFPGRPSINSCNWPGYIYTSGCGGGAMENASCYHHMAPNCSSGPVTYYCELAYKYYCSSISGTMTAYTGPSQWAKGTTDAGCAGGLIIKWATAFGASPPTGFPGGTDISPATPGYYTYCFASAGSIELP